MGLTPSAAHPSVLSIDKVMKQAADAAPRFKKTDPTKKAEFLEAIASNIEELGDALITCAQKETHLPVARLQSERSRTCSQLRQFAVMVREGSWVEASIDSAQPERKPAPKPDLRKMLIPLGPVVVFGASNFPFAYSTAGGDTASALAAGCPVIVKAHPAHPETSSRVAGCIILAAEKTGMPTFVFQHVTDTSVESGQALVMHPFTRAVGFTGSFAGGKALFDLANSRKVPIPVFAEMSSVNPVCILPQALKEDVVAIAARVAVSITNDMGQFCTKPGLQIVPDNEDLVRYVKLLAEAVSKVGPVPMLHEGIAANFYKRKKESLDVQGVKLEAASVVPSSSLLGFPGIASVTASDFIAHLTLHKEVFGPWSLLIRCKDKTEMLQVIDTLEGQLTASIFGTTADLTANSEIIESMSNLAGRIILNGVPTGVEVCPSLVHGGPFPASTDSRFTAVGVPAVKRFVRPQCFQNFPDELLPVELKDKNPKGIWRMEDGEFKRF
jgi:alpha-ketoglutaric semialdehyde dehydrogenase